VIAVLPVIFTFAFAFAFAFTDVLFLIAGIFQKTRKRICVLIGVSMATVVLVVDSSLMAGGIPTRMIVDS
jgi:hypothetical protein